MEQLSKADYHSSIAINMTPLAAFEGISQVSGWWANKIEGSAQKLNDVFTARFGTTWATLKITEFEQGKKIVWLVQDCYLDLLKDKTEWKDTQIIWDIKAEKNQTIVSMTHLGLVPALECFEDCTGGWNFYVGESLFNFLTQNKGIPGTGIRATIANGNHIYEGTLFSSNQSLTEIPSDYVLIDVKDTNVERVTSAYSVKILNKENLDTLNGNHYMIVENKPLFGNIHPLEDLLETVK
jgi:hypothetical protein